MKTQELDKNATDRELHNIRASRKLEMQKTSASGIKNGDVGGGGKLLSASATKGKECVVTATGSDNEWSSDWTWETCSSSDEEGVDFVKNKDGTYAYFTSR